MTVTDRTGEDDATFAALLARVEAADEAPESVRERVARAIHDAQPDAHMCAHDWPCAQAPLNRRLADAALSVVRGEGRQA